MSRRIYLPSSGAPDVIPSTWNHANQAGTTYTIKGVLTKGTTALTSRTTASGTTNPYTRAVMRYVLGPLAPSAISGTINAVLRCSESNSSANATLSLAAKIIQPDGSDRSVLLAATASDSAASPREFTTTLSTRRAFDASEARPITLTTQTPTSGDYLVIEIGFRSASTSSYNGVIQHGDNHASDLPDADGDTNAYAPWVEFSGDIGFLTPPVVTCIDPDDIAATTATGNGNITSDGGASVTKRGFVWSTSTQAAPGNVAPGSSGYSAYVEETGTLSTGAYSGSITGLSIATPYFIRAYAYNAQGYAYSDEITFSSLGYVRLSPSSNIASSAATATTARLSAPSGKTTGDFQAGKISDDTNPLPSIDLGSGKYTELEWCVTVASDAGTADEYEFRVVGDGVALDTYTQTPKVTVETASGNTVTAVTGHLAASGKVATISQAHTVTAVVGHGAFSGKVAAITQPRTVTAVVGHVASSGKVATLTQPRSFPATVGHGVFSGKVATISQPYTVTAVTGHAVTTGHAPSLTQPRSFAATVGHVVLSGKVAVIDQSAAATIQAVAGRITSICYVPEISQPHSITAAVGHLVSSGKVASVTQSANIAAVTGHGSLSGYVATLSQPHTVVAIIGHGLITGKVAVVSQSAARTIDATTGHAALSGKVAAISQPHTITAIIGQGLLTGKVSTILQPHTIGAVSGRISGTGYAPSLTQPRAIASFSGRVNLSGHISLVQQLGAGWGREDGPLTDAISASLVKDAYSAKFISQSYKASIKSESFSAKFTTETLKARIE